MSKLSVPKVSPLAILLPVSYASYFSLTGAGEGSAANRLELIRLLHRLRKFTNSQYKFVHESHRNDSTFMHSVLQRRKLQICRS
ncbi:hypothetical protein BDQ17DRAFT_1377879 [Cyathus striatus]|nr:hypothetical protein BDQ17DRAFT_1377879 [Cyathus striatus]